MTDSVAKRLLVVDSIVVMPGASPGDTASIVFEGPIGAKTPGSGPPGVILLHAPRQSLTAVVTAFDSRWRATVCLSVANWNGTVLPARSGLYGLRAFNSNGERMSLQNHSQSPAAELLPAVCRVSFICSDSGIDVTLSAPLTDRERGAQQQASLESDYRSTKYKPLNAVFFESFYGQTASCNPLAIDRALARIRPDVMRYWSVSDASVEVPPGAIALIDGSAEWWRIRGSARLLVVNDWLRKRFKKRPDQTVLQTWHGTMLKKLALSRVKLGLRPTIATLRERARWDILLAQNNYSKKIFRCAYAFAGPVWQEGYPRDDVLVSKDLSGLKKRLGIPADKTVVLYAPTWRDDRPDRVDHLDVPRFAELLGDGFVTLIRGHSRSLVPGADIHAPNVIDVTGYPDVSELFIAADVLITDYSSVMFDFTVTGKPIFFFTPDLEHYRHNQRGFYFDLLPVAPGPVVSSLEKLISLLNDRNAVAAEYGVRYRAWQQRFNPRDDGGASERVVRRLIAEGILT